MDRLTSSPRPPFSPGFPILLFISLQKAVCSSPAPALWKIKFQWEINFDKVSLPAVNVKAWRIQEDGLLLTYRHDERLDCD